MARARIVKKAGKVLFESPTGEKIWFEDLAAVECPGVIDNLNLFFEMLKETRTLLKKDEEMFSEMIRNGEMVRPEKVHAIIKSLRIGTESMIKAAVGIDKEDKKDEEG